MSTTTPVPPAAAAEARQAAILRSGASWFFWIAALSVVNSILFAAGSNWGFVIGLGIADAADAFGEVVITGVAGTVIALAFDVLVAAGFAGLGLAARKGAQWAFIVGMVIYGLDALLLAWAADWLSVAFHGLALFYLFKGFQASRQLASLRLAAALPPGIAPPITP
jgi:hypothetical protein